MKNDLPIIPPPRGQKPIVVVPRGTAKASLEELRKAGNVPVISNSPAAVKIVTGEVILPQGDVVKAALKALSESSAGHERQVFVGDLYRRLMEREKEAKGGTGA